MGKFCESVYLVNLYPTLFGMYPTLEMFIQSNLEAKIVVVGVGPRVGELALN